MTHVLRTPLLAIDREIEGFNPAAYSPDGRFVVESLSGFQFAMRDAQTFIPLQSPQLVGGPAYEANNYDALA